MSEVILVLVIIALLGYISFKEWISHKQTSKYINALMAKNSQELANLELVDKTTITHSQTPKEADLIPLSEASDELFNHALKNQLRQEDEE